LAHNKDRGGGCICKGAFVAQDAQRMHLRRQGGGIARAVVVSDTEQNEQPDADLADGAPVDVHRSALDAL
jgi:hypothetical protein